jgi:hypothetical protein
MKATAMTLVATLVLLANAAGAWAWPVDGTIKNYETGYIVYTDNGFKFPMSVLFTTLPNGDPTGYASPNEVTTAGWVVADFEGGITNPGGTVTVTLTAPHLSVSGSGQREYVKEWLFNIDPSVNLGQISVTAGDLSGAVAPTVNVQKDAFSMGSTGTGRFDVQMLFNTTGGTASRFEAGDSVKLTFTGGSDLTAESFLQPSAYGDGEWCFNTIALLGNTGVNFDADTVVTPEPATLSLLGLGSLIAIRRMRRRQA